jgi:hypothetical protein
MRPFLLVAAALLTLGSALLDPLQTRAQPTNPHGELLVCREPQLERYYVAERPMAWTRDEEERAVANLQEMLGLG